MKKIIFFELNEVPLKVFNYYIKAKPNSWLANNFSKLKKYETITENKGHLSPWSTWPTLHRGVANDQHYILDFNVDLTPVNKEFPPIWEILSENNIKTGVFGSLHSYPLPAKRDNYSFYVPDVFAAGKECFPNSVELFQDINLKLSRRSARNVDSHIPYMDALKLLFKINQYGFTMSTLSDVGSHLVQEKIDAWKTVRRRTYQTVLSFDVFYKLLKTEKPDFVTFFTNHVASSMHRYWAALFPEDYETLMHDDKWISKYGNEIIFTMDQTDKMLKKLANFVDSNPEYKLLMTSSMGQHAIECKPIETQLYMVDCKTFMSMLGLNNGSDYIELPAMLPQHNFSISTNMVTVFEGNLDTFTINGESVKYRKNGANQFSIDLGQENLTKVEVIVNGKHIPFENSGMRNTEIEDKSGSTAYHIPEGHLFSYHPSYTNSAFSQNQVYTCDIVPMLMNNFGLEKKGYMNKTNLANI